MASETDDATADFALFCFDIKASRMRETPAVYDAATRKFTGATRCP